MADSNEPDWSLLPHDPTRFFGLDAGFDRRDLKRSYNQLLRRFKPERFPQEFQRIRAAYEQLEEAIRYGQSTDALESSGESFEWLAQAPGQPSTPSYSASPTPVVPLHELIKTGSVSKVYRELQDRPDKTPYDFYALAVMSDVVDRQENGRQFADWLLKGLAAFPGEVGLSRLLHSYFRSPIDTEQCAALLVQCSKIVSEGMFFPLTEPLWRSLLREQNFSHFRDALRQCEANLKGVNIDNRLAFTMQILKPAVWVADAEWINDAFSFIEQNYDRIPGYLDYDLEILARLRGYIRVREQFVQGDEVRDRLDRAMRDYFSEDQFKGDQSVLASQVLLAQDPDRLAAAFSDFGNETYSAFYAVWMWVSYDVAERHVEPPKEAVDENIWHSRTGTLLSQIERQTVGSRMGIKWATQRVVYRGAQAAGYVAALTLSCLVMVGIGGLFSDLSRSRSNGDAGIVIGAFTGIALGLFFGFRLSKRIEKSYWNPFTLRISADCYRQMWRREILNFLARSHISYQALRAYIQSYPAKVTSAAWVKHYVDQDYTLPLFAIAQCFVV